MILWTATHADGTLNEWLGGQSPPDPIDWTIRTVPGEGELSVTQMCGPKGQYVHALASHLLHADQHDQSAKICRYREIQGRSEVWLSTWLMLPQTIASKSGWGINVLQIKTNHPNNPLYCVILSLASGTTTVNVDRYHLGEWAARVKPRVAQPVLRAGIWTHLELYVKQARSGAMSCWVNGAQCWSESRIDLRESGNPISNFVIGLYADGVLPSDLHGYYYAPTISTTRVGP